MSVLEFIAQMTRALAWPTAAVVVALVFKSQIKSLFARDKGSLLVAGFGVTWETASREVRSELKIASPTARESSGVATSIDNIDTYDLDRPEDALAEGWARVERALYEKVGDDAFQFGSVDRLMQAALDRGLITLETARAIHGLRIMRDLGVRGSTSDVTRARATEFLLLVEAVLYTLGNRVSPDNAG